MNFFFLTTTQQKKKELLALSTMTVVELTKLDYVSVVYVNVE
jgi:hypothetical protein